MTEALVVASNRSGSVLEFARKWMEKIDFRNVSLIVMHDSEKEEESRKLYKNLVELLGEDILLQVFNHCIVGENLKDKAWIISKNSSACKAYPIFKAFEQGCERVYVLDDDCYPVKGEVWLTNHRGNLSRKVQNHVMPTIHGIRPRGIPYLEPNKIMLSHGLWKGVPDVDAVTQMNGYGEYWEVIGAVPQGALFPFCGMNFGVRREAIPLMYFGLQGPEWGVDRYDDIWCGFLAKRIMDHMDWAVWTGSPCVDHTRLSNALVNLEKEAPGYRMNCEFYGFVMNLEVIGGNVTTCLKYVGARLIAWARHSSNFGEYFEKYGEAMMEWASLFEEA